MNIIRRPKQSDVTIHLMSPDFEHSFLTPKEHMGSPENRMGKLDDMIARLWRQCLGDAI